MHSPTNTRSAYLFYIDVHFTPIVKTYYTLLKKHIIKNQNVLLLYLQTYGRFNGYVCYKFITSNGTNGKMQILLHTFFIFFSKKNYML